MAASPEAGPAQYNGQFPSAVPHTSVRCRGCIQRLLSGLQAGGPSSGPGNVVSLRAAELGAVATTKTSVLMVRSGSGSWLLMKATSVP